MSPTWKRWGAGPVALALAMGCVTRDSGAGGDGSGTGTGTGGGHDGGSTASQTGSDSNGATGEASGGPSGPSDDSATTGPGCAPWSESCEAVPCCDPSNVCHASTLRCVEPDDTASGGFIDSGFDFHAPGCDPGLQDCPNPDEKCTALATTPGSCELDIDDCVPVIDQLQFGDACTKTEVNDDCDKGLFCATIEVDGTGPGLCMHLCIPGTPDPCPDSGVCVPLENGGLPLCFSTCDPLLQACGGGQVCAPVLDEFVCMRGAFGPGEGDDGDDCTGCYAEQRCRAGNACVRASVTTCDDLASDRCCTPLCDLTLGTTGNPACVDPAEECVPWFVVNPPPGLKDVGACSK